jgi:GTP-binding protein
VIAVADAQLTTLLDLRYQKLYKAGRGEHGMGKDCHGRRGADRVIHVPVGTIVRDARREELIGDLNVAGQQVVLAAGGRGGKGNAHFVSSTNRSPRYAQPGLPGEEKELAIELRLLADVGIIGLPNAGKSTLISAISSVRPKIADYPFTTLVPNLGVVGYGDGKSFVVADIPGLIEGAAEGKGLGHEFLRHTERARVLVMLLDPDTSQPNPPAEQLEILRREIADYSPELAARPSLVVMNKSDLESAHDAAPALDAMPVSALTGDGLRPVLHAIADLVDEAEREAPERRGFILHRPVGAMFTIKREDDSWRIEGRSAERAVAFADLTLPEAADMAARRLARLGVDEALSEAGAIAGDEVRIGDLAFEFTPEMSEEE